MMVLKIETISYGKANNSVEEAHSQAEGSG
jgi:hypothetical protein